MARAVVVNAAQLASYSQSKQFLLDSGEVGGGSPKLGVPWGGYGGPGEGYGGLRGVLIPNIGVPRGVRGSQGGPGPQCWDVWGGIGGVLVPKIGV